MRKFCLIFLLSLLCGCAQGRLDILDQDGKIVGFCSADFYFHWYGAKDSVNYILYICAKEHLANGYKISDESILNNDYSIPLAPKGKHWNKKLAKEQFFEGYISEEKFGYILASIEYQYWERIKEAKNKLSESIITQAEYEKAIERAKIDFEGV